MRLVLVNSETDLRPYSKQFLYLSFTTCIINWKIVNYPSQTLLSLPKILNMSDFIPLCSPGNFQIKTGTQYLCAVNTSPGVELVIVLFLCRTTYARSYIMQILQFPSLNTLISSMSRFALLRVDLQCEKVLCFCTISYFQAESAGTYPELQLNRSILKIHDWE